MTCTTSFLIFAPIPSFRHPLEKEFGLDLQFSMEPLLKFSNHPIVNVLSVLYTKILRENFPERKEVSKEQDHTIFVNGLCLPDCLNVTEPCVNPGDPAH